LKAVRPYSTKGKILCYTIQCLCFFIALFRGKKWERAIEFEENPRTMTFRDLVYFSYKYYYKSPLLPSADKIKKHFSEKSDNTADFKTLLTVSIGGDLMPYDLITPENTKHLWEEVGADFFGSDIVFANLETPLDKDKKSNAVPEVMLNHMYFNTDETTFEVFSGHGIYKGYDILSIANNHSLDMGETGLEKTINFLERTGIKTVGAKKDKSDKDFQIIEVKGVKIGFVAYTYSLNEFLPAEGREWMVNYLPLNTADCDLNMILEQVTACKEAGAEFIICSMHCGNAYQAYPSAQTIALYEKVFKTCGVDVIAGGHPHNLQPWKTYAYTDPFSGKAKTGFAIYSLADFIAYDIYTWCHLCAYLQLEIGRGADGKILFRPRVKPMVMLREDGQLKLKYAERLLNSGQMTEELKDIQILYDICAS